jgi:hypothetical protein
VQFLLAHWDASDICSPLFVEYQRCLACLSTENLLCLLCSKQESDKLASVLEFIEMVWYLHERPILSPSMTLTLRLRGGGRISCDMAANPLWWFYHASQSSFTSATLAVHLVYPSNHVSVPSQFLITNNSVSEHQIDIVLYSLTFIHAMPSYVRSVCILGLQIPRRRVYTAAHDANNHAITFVVFAANIAHLHPMHVAYRAKVIFYGDVT